MRLLIIKANQLGDNIVFLPVVRELVARLGADALTLLTSPAAAPLYEGLLPRGNMWLEPTAKLLGAWRHPLRMARLAKHARSVNADAALVAFDQGNVGRLLSWMSGAEVRAGVEHPATRVNGALTHRVDFAEDEPMPVRDWTAMRLLLDALGVAGCGSIAARPPQPDLRHLFPGGHRPARDARRIFIHPGASRAYKRWPEKRFVALANRLAAERDFEVLWSQTAGVPAPGGLSKTVERVAQASIADLATGLAGCGLFVGNNSGPMNVAVAVGTPTLVFNGPSPFCWDPLWQPEIHRLLRVEKLACQPCDPAAYPRGRCSNVHEPMACMERWTVDAAAAQAKEHWRSCWGAVPVPDRILHPMPQLSAPVL